MIFCDKCFKDNELSAIVRASNTTSGICPICGKLGVLYDTDKQGDLTPYFEDLLGVYSTEELLPEEYPVQERHTLADELNDRWSLFSDIPAEAQRGIVISVCPDLYLSTPELFSGRVGIPELYSTSYVRNYALLKNNDWEGFVNEIKIRNRYHSGMINHEVLKNYCRIIRKDYKAGKLFCRARISDRTGYPADQMSAPKPGTSNEGRVNARGIVCLYISNDEDTAIHEVRAAAFDYVSVGTFRLKRDITVVDLKAINTISPFNEKLDYVSYAVNKQYLEKLNDEISRPLRRSDSSLDYVPTQYIADHIKSIEEDGVREYDGIEYKSTINAGGYNLAVFDPEIFECVGVDVYDIKSLEYEKKKI